MSNLTEGQVELQQEIKHFLTKDGRQTVLLTVSLTSKLCSEMKNGLVCSQRTEPDLAKVHTKRNKKFCCSF